MKLSQQYPVCGFGMAMVALLGCAQVKPAADYDRAGKLITERTGNDAAYNPDEDKLVADKVEDLLADGLTIEEAVRVALLNNPGFQSAFQEIGVSRADLVQSGLFTNPSFSIMGKLPEAGGRAMIELSFGQELVDLWQIPIRKEIARAQLEAVILDVAQRAIQLAADVRVRCYELLAVQQTENTVRESLALVEQSVQLAQEQYKAGAVSQLDVNLARTSTFDIRLEFISIEREREIARFRLERLLGLSAYTKTWTLIGDLPQPGASWDDNALVSTALSQRLDAQMAEYKVKAAEGELRQEYLKVFPSVEVGLDAERMERRAMPGRKILADAVRESIRNGTPTVPDIQTPAERDFERRQMIDFKLGPSLALTLPIWDQNQAQIAKAGYRVLQRRKDYENVLDQVVNEVEQAVAVVNNAASSVRFYNEQALPQARANVEAGKRVYQAGEQNILVLIEFENSLIVRHRAYVRALGDYAVARAELERAIGGPLPPPSTQPAASQPLP